MMDEIDRLADAISRELFAPTPDPRLGLIVPMRQLPVGHPSRRLGLQGLVTMRRLRREAERTARLVSVHPMHRDAP